MPKSTLIRWVRLLALSALAATVLYGEDITGTVIVKKKMTKHRVTAAVSMYERGPTVELGKDQETDPIAFERSRVVVYIEGDGLACSPAGPRVHGSERPAFRTRPGGDTGRIVGVLPQYGPDLP